MELRSAARKAQHTECNVRLRGVSGIQTAVWNKINLSYRYSYHCSGDVTLSTLKTSKGKNRNAQNIALRSSLNILTKTWK